MVKDKRVESAVAIGAFLAAVGLAFTAITIRSDHDFTAGVLMMVAQFLMLTASIFGLDYKLSQFIHRYGRQEQAEEAAKGNHK